MRWFLRLLAVGALTASYSLSASAADNKPGSVLPIEPTCGDHGTSIKFAKNPKEAAIKALTSVHSWCKVVARLRGPCLDAPPDPTPARIPLSPRRDLATN